MKAAVYWRKKQQSIFRLEKVFGLTKVIPAR